MEEYVYTSRNEERLKIQIPKDAVQSVVRMRHSELIPNGQDDPQSTLSYPGAQLALAVQSNYTGLLGFLRQSFGDPVIACSGWMAAILTAYLSTGASRITPYSPLQLLKLAQLAAPAGSTHPNLQEHWHAEGLSVQEMIVRIAQDTHLYAGSEFIRALAKSVEFNLNAFSSHKLVMAVDHEDTISLTAAREGASTDLLGLHECQAFVFFYSHAGECLSVQKFAPEITCPR